MPRSNDELARLCAAEAEGFEEGVRQERAAIVAYLNKHGRSRYLHGGDFARSIAAGEHHTDLAPGCSSCEYKRGGECDHPDVRDVPAKGRELPGGAAPTWCPVRKRQGSEP